MSESRLTGLVVRKGEAPRPAETPSRSPAPSPAPVSAPVPAGGSKALTVKLSDADYERLRRFAFDARTTHQAVIQRAIFEFLDRQG